MNIAQDTVVTLRYQMLELLPGARTGRVLDQDSVAYLHGGYDNIFPKVEAGLHGLEPGQTFSVDLPAAHAYGPYEQGLQRTIARSEFPPGVKVGGQLRGTGDDGQPQMFYVVKIKGQQVLLDANHPLAGKDIRFTCRVLAVRAATPEEITHRHAHGEHGHHHH